MAGRTGNPSDYQQALSDNAIPASVGMQVQEADPRTKATKDWLANAASMAMVADNNEYEPTMRALYRAGKAQGVDFSQFGINSEDEMAKVPRSSVAIATGMVSHDTIKEIVKQKSKLLTENQDVMSTPQLYVNPQNGRQEMWYFRKSGEPARFIRVATKQDIKGPDAEKPLTGDTAGKLAMLNQASRDISELPSMLYVNGKLDLGRLTGGFFGAPSELGREINSRIDNAVAAKLRAETGAAATPGEVENISKRFKPKPGLDDEKAVSDKLTRLKEYLDEAAYFIDPQGAHRAGAARDRESKGALFSAPKKVGRFIVEVEGK